MRVPVGAAAPRPPATAAPGRLTVGYSGGLIVTPATSALRRRRPEAEVRTVHLGWCRPAEGLLDRQVDAVVARLPFPDDGLRVTHLYDEPRAVVVRRDHRLAARPFLTLEDIADEPLPWVPGTDPACAAFWRLEPRPDGRPAPKGPAMNALDDTWEFVAAGDAVAVTFLSHAQTVRPDLTLVPLRGVEPSHVVLATRADDNEPLVSEFRRCAVTHLAPSDRLDQPIGGARYSSA
ncbi:LysR family substrate-binding domain-containing protein [Amycolatopsis sp. NPDC059027]|uniref:LysR family substrate-binding domain-containing protein n=1 Tax=Amycolatopsis sp. NPDC059027 TaxID=3346709 RepID=UPI00366DB5E9